jgi:hypothetical protein
LGRHFQSQIRRRFGFRHSHATLLNSLPVLEATDPAQKEKARQWRAFKNVRSCCLSSRQPFSAEPTA